MTSPPADGAAPRATRPSATRVALVEAAYGLARQGGPDAVGLREVTRRAGVSHNAPYRHFADLDELLDEVSSLALGAMTDELRARATTAEGDGDELALALDRLRVVGRGYVHFALAEPGLFAVAFGRKGAERWPQGEMPADGGPYDVLRDALDGLVRVGFLSPSDREGAEVVCWSTVHGFASLFLEGPVRWFEESEREARLDHLLETVVRGLRASAVDAG